MGKSKQSKQPKKYLIISENAKPSKFVDAGARVMKNELIISHYASEGNIGYYYYEIIK